MTGPEELGSGEAPSVSVVVPAFNSAKTLPELCQRLEKVLSSFAPEHEVILVNDGSEDETWEVIQSMAAAHPRVRGVDLMRNYGQHNALLCGVRAARFEVIVTMDDDLQNPPEELPRLCGKLAEGYDVVYGTPLDRSRDVLRALASYVVRWVLSGTMGADAARNVSTFRAFRRDLRRAFAEYRSPYVSLDVLLSWATKRFGSVSLAHQEREHGRSTYTLSRLVTLAGTMMTGYSVRPLQFASALGFAFTFFGFLVLVYVVGRYLIQGAGVQGFAFLASIIAVFSGVQLFSLGIIGEYLARMHFRMMEQPPYVVDGTTDSDAPGGREGPG